MLLLVAALSFFVCLFVLPIAMSVSRKVGLVDHPDARKNHLRSTPLVGGICIFIALAVGIFAISGGLVSLSLFSWVSIVLVVGVADDFLDLPYLLRMFIHAVVVVGIWYTDGLLVSSVGAIFTPESPLVLSTAVGLVVTIVAVIGATNAVNMIDGVDGLLCSLALMSLVSVFLLSIYRSEPSLAGYKVFSAVEIVALIGAVAAFLVLNARLIDHRGAPVFLGDAGSTLLGFLLAYILIDITQSSGALVSPVVACWIIGVPLLDASAVILNRLLRGRSPVSPGRDHIHHVLLDYGLSVNRVVQTLVLTQFLMIIVAVSVERLNLKYSDFLLFWGFIALVILHAGGIHRFFRGSGSTMRKKRSKQVVCGALYNSTNRKRIKRKAPGSTSAAA